MEEPVQQTTEDNEAVSPEAPKVFDYASIVAERLNKPFDYKKAYGRQPAIQLRKKTFDELLTQIEQGDSKEDSDSDDDEPIEVHASVGERSIKTLTNVPIVHAFNMAESHLASKSNQ
ncbi:unnamed protein product [Caenorhabditis brenneri]